MARKDISNSSFFSNKKNKLFESKNNVGTVVYVHIDDSKAQDVTLPSDLTSLVHNKEMVIGHAKIATRGDSTVNIKNIPEYPPANPDEGLPLIGETVEMISLAGKLHYKRIPNSDINSGNAQEDSLLLGNPTEESTSKKGQSYSQTAQTGTPVAGEGSSDRKTKLGEYFEPTKVNPLKFYEGDKVIQSRFGQSIRFSGYNNEENVLAPTIIIRNRQNDKSIEDLKEFETVEEDIVNDGSIIVLSSGEYELQFVPGNENTKLEKIDSVVYFTQPQLKGSDQILINSGRIILSSKESEMIFYSKGDYSFISDGKLTIDNGDGAEIDLNGEYRTTTNDNNMYFLGGSGEIYLNTESDKEPLARGQTLIDILAELIDTINKQVFSTPSGPTAVGPNNRADFNKIKDKLETILSTLNYTE